VHDFSDRIEKLSHSFGAILRLLHAETGEIGLRRIDAGRKADSETSRSLSHFPEKLVLAQTGDAHRIRSASACSKILVAKHFSEMEQRVGSWRLHTCNSGKIDERHETVTEVLFVIAMA
jgi:hypothetical protein